MFDLGPLVTGPCTRSNPEIDSVAQVEIELGFHLGANSGPLLISLGAVSSLDLGEDFGEQFGRGAGAGPQDPLAALRRMLMGPIEPGSSPMTIPPSFGEAGRLLAPRLPPRPTTTASEYPQPSVLPLPPEYQ